LNFCFRRAKLKREHRSHDRHSTKGTTDDRAL
jgi:hypothetical protein